MPATDDAWMYRPYIYAALAATDDLAEAARMLADRGMSYTENQLRAYRQNGPHLLQQARQHALHQRYFNTPADPSADTPADSSDKPLANAPRQPPDPPTDDLYGRLDDMARRIERRLAAGDWQEKNEVDLVDRYLKLMQQMAEMRQRSQAEPEGDGAEHDHDMEEVLRRLEQAGDSQHVHDAMRRAAAATGTLFDPPAGQ